MKYYFYFSYYIIKLVSFRNKVKFGISQLIVCIEIFNPIKKSLDLIFFSYMFEPSIIISSLVLKFSLVLLVFCHFYIDIYEFCVQRYIYWKNCVFMTTYGWVVTNFECLRLLKYQNYVGILLNIVYSSFFFLFLNFIMTQLWTCIYLVILSNICAIHI